MQTDKDKIIELEDRQTDLELQQAELEDQFASEEISEGEFCSKMEVIEMELAEIEEEKEKLQNKQLQ